MPVTQFNHPLPQLPSTFPQPLSVTFPDWLSQVVKPGDLYASEEARMQLAIKLSELQVQHDSGGPFGAVVCELVSGAVVGVGVNRVVPNNASIAHAEVVAWSSAQQLLSSYDLSAPGLPPLGLYTSSQPCIACWGGLFWTGLCGASKQDVEDLTGFNEGPVPHDWDLLLAQAGIAVELEVCRDQACKVLSEYGRSGIIYNPSR